VPTSEEAPLTISEAAQVLGVSEAALRLWTDEGKIKAFVTPGGHRRYSRTELKKFASKETRMLGVKDVVTQMEETFGQHREISKTYFSTSPREGDLSRKYQQALAGSGHDLLQLIMQYISEPANRAATLQKIREVSARHGEISANLGLSLTDSVQAFLLHREPIIKSTTLLIKKREGNSGRIINLIPMIGQVLDEALLAHVAAHQQAQQGARVQEKRTP
jgi:excisionase family DNA binding protein